MVLLSILWVIYFAVHSLLASDLSKKWVAERLPSFYRYYRIAYNLIGLICFMALFFFQRRTEDAVIAPLPLLITWAGIGLVAAGALIILASFRNYSIREFTGLQPAVGAKRANALTKKGLNSYVRHPIYFGTLVALLGYLMYSFTVNTLIFVIIAITYLFVGSVLEERKLVRMHGQAYIEYQKNVPRIIPWFRR